jgi:hypothetical protein
MDDGGMSIRLDPRRLGALKLLAAEAGVRPGELVTRWVEERLDAARGGSVAAAADGGALASLSARVEELARRIDELAAMSAATAPTTATAVEPAVAEAPAKRGRGRPRKVADGTDASASGAGRPARRSARSGAKGPKIALHDEIVAVISELGPQTAAELASAIAARGRYQAPRTAKPLDAATVNARVSNPTYRGRFVRREHRIGLASE